MSMKEFSMNPDILHLPYYLYHVTYSTSVSCIVSWNGKWNSKV